MSTTASPAVDHRVEISAVDSPLCGLCGKPGSELYAGMSDWLFGVPGNWNLYYCSCGIVWLNPRPTLEDIPKLYARYYTHYGVTHPSSVERLRREILKCELKKLGYDVERSNKWLANLLSYISPIARARSLEVFALPFSQRGSLLDVGCGNGDFIRQMRSLGWTVAGVDPDPSAVAFGSKDGLRIFEGTISDVPADQRYDVITLSHVIEHVPDATHLLRECKKRIRETGRIVITTPNLRSLGHKWFRRYWRGLEVPRHFNVYSTSSIEACAFRAGLQVHALSTETRMARMIYSSSRCAKRGQRNVGELVAFDTNTKIGAYLFRMLESLMVCFNKNLGEEIFCVCGHPPETLGSKT